MNHVNDRNFNECEKTPFAAEKLQEIYRKYKGSENSFNHRKPLASIPRNFEDFSRDASIQRTETGSEIKVSSGMKSESLRKGT